MLSYRETAMGYAQEAQESPKGGEIPPPTGTLFVMIVYLAVLMALWLAMYAGLLGS